METKVDIEFGSKTTNSKFTSIDIQVFKENRSLLESIINDVLAILCEYKYRKTSSEIAQIIRNKMDTYKTDNTFCIGRTQTNNNTTITTTKEINDLITSAEEANENISKIIKLKNNNFVNLYSIYCINMVYLKAISIVEKSNITNSNLDKIQKEINESIEEIEKKITLNKQYPDSNAKKLYEELQNIDINDMKNIRDNIVVSAPIATLPINITNIFNPSSPNTNNMNGYAIASQIIEMKRIPPGILDKDRIESLDFDKKLSSDLKSKKLYSAIAEENIKDKKIREKLDDLLKIAILNTLESGNRKYCI